jgi:peptidoglycan/xylan/chitin deacetylase (PgdA/CDA1 family)
MLPSIPLESFKQQMVFLKKSFEILPLTELSRKLHKGERLPQRLACVTFDDGYKDTFTQAAPVLESLGIPATVFITAGIIEDREAFWWDRMCYSIMRSNVNKIKICSNEQPLPSNPDKRLQAARHIIEMVKGLDYYETLAVTNEVELQTGVCIPPDIKDCLTMQWKDVRAMYDAGIDIGSHTLSHPSLRKVTHAEAHRQIRGSRDLIYQRTGITAHHFSYPHGHATDITRGIASIVRDAGYESACTIMPSPVDKSTDPYLIGRALPEYHPDIFYAYACGMLQRFYGSRQGNCVQD